MIHIVQRLRNWWVRTSVKWVERKISENAFITAVAAETEALGLVPESREFYDYVFKRLREGKR